MTFDVVIPTTGRASLARLLEALLRDGGPPPRRVIVVDDRPERSARSARNQAALPLGPAAGDPRVTVLRGDGRGPAAARNRGWRAAEADWVSFLDDDVEPPPGWRAALVADLVAVGERVAGSQGRIVVPLPRGRRPTDWERNTAALERARWATADMAYRRAALAAVGGFDERFRRAYREDADLGLRLRRAGWEIAPGRRHVVHPVRPADRWVSLRLQAGNADDVL
ncbi:MAG: glycosyltransferase family 2 protein, partial [Nocardioidaceae bacterium]